MGFGFPMDSDIANHDRRPHLRAASLRPPATGLVRPNLRVELEITDDAVVAHLAGRLDIRGSMQLWSVLRHLTVDRPLLLLDLAGVPEIEPRALAVVVATQQRLGHTRSRLALWRLRAQPLRLFRERRLHQVVEIVRGPLDVWLAGQRAANRTPGAPRQAKPSPSPAAVLPPAPRRQPGSPRRTQPVASAAS